MGFLGGPRKIPAAPRQPLPSTAMQKVGIRLLTGRRLSFSRNPAAMIAGAALEAMRATGQPDGDTDFIVVAVPLGGAPVATRAITDAMRAAPDELVEPEDVTADE